MNKSGTRKAAGFLNNFALSNFNVLCRYDVVYYVDHNTQTTTYIRPLGGPGKVLPFVGMPAGGDSANV